jgi:hypothetical protein
MQEKMDAHQERMEVKMDAWLEEMKAKRDNGLLGSDRSLSRKDEGQPRECKGWPGRNGGRGMSSKKG